MTRWSVVEAHFTTVIKADEEGDQTGNEGRQDRHGLSGDHFERAVWGKTERKLGEDQIDAAEIKLTLRGGGPVNLAVRMVLE